MPQAKNGGYSSKLALLYTLRVLKDKSKPGKPITALKTIELLEHKYGIAPNKRTMKQILELLEGDAESCVFCECGPSGKRKYNWYCDPEPLFDRWELIYLAEGVASSQKVPPDHKKKLIEKLKKHGANTQLTALQKTKSADKCATDNAAFFPNIELIDEAMTEGRCLSFHLGEHNLKGELFYPRNEDPRIVDPEFIFVHNARYYLRATPHGGNKSLNYRIDMILGMEIALDENKKPIIPIVKAYDPNDKESEEQFKDVHLFGDETADKVKLRVVNSPKNRYQLFDQFGEDVKLSLYGKDRTFLTATFRANRITLKAWVMGHPDDVEVIEPADLREEIHASAVALAEKYKSEGKE